MQFTVLASGSAGNSCFLEAGGHGLLLDLGLGPRQLAQRLAAVGASWPRVHAALLTHTHSDHWNDRTLAYLHRLRIPLYCHPQHHRGLAAYSSGFQALQEAGLVRPYEIGRDFEPAPGLRCRPLPLRHDGGLTCGFRLEMPAESAGPSRALGYAADLGSWGLDLARSLGDVDLLALEFNHDVALERGSGRSPRLIARVLGDDGHLSNVQAATLLGAVLQLSAPGRLRQVVQLHLSRDCNRPALAAAAAQTVLDRAAHAIQLHTACQDNPSPTFAVGAGCSEAGAFARPARAPRRRPSRPAAPSQPWLPGFGLEDEAG